MLFLFLTVYIYRAHLDFASCGLDSWRRYNLKDVCWCFSEEAGFPPLGGTGEIPPLLKKLTCPPMFSATVLTQKCWFCNFHAGFGHFTQIVPPSVDPIWGTLRSGKLIWLGGTWIAWQRVLPGGTGNSSKLVLHLYMEEQRDEGRGFKLSCGGNPQKQHHFLWGADPSRYNEYR